MNRLPSQVLHNTVQDMKKIGGLPCAIWDQDGVLLAMTDAGMQALTPEVAAFLKGPSGGERWEETHALLSVAEAGAPALCLAIQGNNPKRETVGRMGVSQLTNLLTVYKEKTDKNRFIRQILTGDIHPADADAWARQLGVPVSARRLVFLVEAAGTQTELLTRTLRGLFEIGSKDFLAEHLPGELMLVTTLTPSQSEAEIEGMARSIVDTINTEVMVPVRVAYGTAFQELSRASACYEEARDALEVGRIFYPDRTVLSYHALGIGRLIHGLPLSLCELFLQEVFSGEAAALFDEEELRSVFTFFDYNLNISEAARQLYVHRNTLVNRLDKIQRKTGLDVRIFDDAVTFKIAMMVTDHVRAAQS